MHDTMRARDPRSNPMQSLLSSRSRRSDTMESWGIRINALDNADHRTAVNLPPKCQPDIACVEEYYREFSLYLELNDATRPPLPPTPPLLASETPRTRRLEGGLVPSSFPPPPRAYERENDIEQPSQCQTPRANRPPWLGPEPAPAAVRDGMHRPLSNEEREREMARAIAMHGDDRLFHEASIYVRGHILMQERVRLREEVAKRNNDSM